MTLTQIVTNLEPRLQETLSAITVHYRNGEASTILNFALYLPSTGGVDEDDLPKGVSVSGVERWPDRSYQINATPIGEQIKELQSSGLVGNLDAVRMDRGTEGVQAGYDRYVWHIKTHAGSRKERAIWLRQITHQ